jgi:hypothetical protein
MDTNKKGWERKGNLAGKQETAGKQEISTEDKCDFWRDSLRAVRDRERKGQRRSYGFRGFHGWKTHLKIWKG